MTKERILFLTVSYHTVNFFRPMIKTLLREGQEVKIYCIDDLPYGAREDKFHVRKVDWHLFKWERINKYDPTRVVIFNGAFKPIHAASKVLRAKYKHTIIAEVAWLSQNYNIYLDRDIHNLSNIYEFPVTIKDNLAANVENLMLRKRQETAYQVKILPMPLPPNYVLVPLQLERDTSIVYASHVFKDMKSLVGYVRNSLPAHVPVVVKVHPKAKMDSTELPFKMEGCIFIDDPTVTMSDLVVNAKLIVGINSTSLIEALLFKKPVICLGHSILTPTPFIRIDMTKSDSLKIIYDNPSDHCIPQATIDFFLAYLIANQIDFMNPPRWAVDRIITGDTTPRTVDEYFEDGC